MLWPIKMADLCRSHSLLAIMLALCGACCLAQEKPAEPAQKSRDKQINVNWLYGSYIPKEVPRRSLNGSERLKLYVRQTYLTPGIYVKTTLFALHDQITDRNPEWGD